MSRTLPLLFAIYPLLLSGSALWWLLRSRPTGTSGWALRATASGSVVVFAFLTGPWSFTSHYLRYVVLGLFVAAVAVSYVRMKRRPPTAAAPAAGAAAGAARRPVAAMVCLVVFAGLDAAALASRFERAESLDLAFPLGSGTYSVLQGGAGLVTNPFHTLSGGGRALDIVKLNRLGNRARGLVPRALRAYEIYGDTLLSPCAGKVASARDDLPDHPPGEPDRDHPEGNFVALACGEAVVLLGHLRQGSLDVAPGDAVTAGQPIAEVGNSGYTLEPHLHIEARNQRGELRLGFDGRLPSVNSVVIRGRAGDPPPPG